MNTFFISFSLICIAFMGIAIKILLKKSGKFSGTCASQNQNFNENKKPCSFCGKMPKDCENKNL